jgi:hypothetical protein
MEFRYANICDHQDPFPTLEMKNVVRFKVTVATVFAVQSLESIDQAEHLAQRP